MADTTVKFLHSAMAGAPTLSGTAGTLVGLLDACLVNGFGTGTVDSVVIAGGVATVTRGSGHPMEVGAVSLIAGAVVSGGNINGEQKVLSISGTQYTFDATGIPDQTATGTITHKLAPLGWVKQYAGTNLAAYKSGDPLASGMLLRIDDTGAGAARYARAVGYEAMSDINTGTGLFPSSAQLNGGAYWQKSASNDATTRPWVVVGDARFFYFLPLYSGVSAYSASAAFGDIARVSTTDAFSVLHHALSSDNGSNTSGNIAQELDNTFDSSSSTASYLARPYTGLGAPNLASRAYAIPVLTTVSARSGAPSNNHMPYPNFADGGLYVSPWTLTEWGSKVLRGGLPGFYAIPQSVGSSVFANREVVTGVAGLPGRALRVFNSQTGCFAFDTTGPWR